MEAYKTQLHELLIGAYDSIGRLEECMLRQTHSMNLTIGELHRIECIGKRINAGCTISDLAKDLGITLPSVTVGIQKLEKKGFVQKSRSPKDKRTRYVALTPLGERMDKVHRYFHRRMIDALLNTMNTEEKEQLFRAMQRLNKFLISTLSSMRV